MTDRPDDPPAPLLLRLRLRLAGAALWWERAWPALWPALFVAGLFVVLALFGLFALLPGLVHAALLLAFGAALLLALRTAGRDLAMPGRAAARRRLERASGLAHRPLEALADRPGAPLDVPAARLWEAHRQRMATAARRLRVGWPAAGLANRDPWGLRALLALVLLLGAIDAGGDWRDRLLRAVTPALDNGIPAPAASLDIWVTPPDYTGLPPLFLRPGETQTIPVPVGSKLLAQVHGGGAVPRLAIDATRRDFDAIDKENFRAQQIMKAGRRITVSQAGEVLGSWRIAIIPDHPPTVAFVRPPAATLRQALRIDYRASDDYGVEKVTAVIRLARTAADPARGGKRAAPITLSLPLPGLHLRKAQATSYHDLTPSPWAGLPVEIRLVATDALGQTGTSEPVRMTLPQRVFHNPVARAIVEQRKELARDPGSRLVVAEILGDLHAQPQFYGNDAMAFLGLRVAQERLRLDHDAAAIDEVQQLLWDVALRIENDQAALAQTELRRLERQLQDALAKGAPDQEVNRLTRELRQALDRYLQALAQNLARHPPQNQPVPDAARMLSSRDLERMIERARELAMSGDRDQARALLAQLQNMLENLRMAGPGQMPPGSAEAQQVMQGMRQLMQRQQQLLDRSFHAEQQAQQGRSAAPGSQAPGSQAPGSQAPGAQGSDASSGNADMSSAAAEQEALRQSLGDMMRRIGEGAGDIPAPLGRAERAMRQAAQALRQQQPGAAIDPQTDALDQLGQAARQFAQSMERRAGSASGMPADDPSGGGRDRLERDPLGRPLANGGPYDEGDVKIPDKATMQKAREILDELRRRAGEPDRPPVEHDYIDRLLQPF
ncbi:MAG TPA: TIGR02302 family protein [Stellaceae bacterium]|nr:TIGR02302 family protein [Stellaceae bacterium]